MEPVCKISDFYDRSLGKRRPGRRTADGGRTLQIWNLHTLKRKVAKFEGGLKKFFAIR